MSEVDTSRERWATMLIGCACLDQTRLENIRRMVNALLDERDRLRQIIADDGLDPDMPIPPGLALRCSRLEAERDELNKRYLEAERNMRIMGPRSRP